MSQHANSPAFNVHSSLTTFTFVASFFKWAPRKQNTANILIGNMNGMKVKTTTTRYSLEIQSPSEYGHGT